MINIVSFIPLGDNKAHSNPCGSQALVCCESLLFYVQCHSFYFLLQHYHPIYFCTFVFLYFWSLWPSDTEVSGGSSHLCLHFGSVVTSKGQILDASNLDTALLPTSFTIIMQTSYFPI